MKLICSLGYGGKTNMAGAKRCTNDDSRALVH